MVPTEFSSLGEMSGREIIFGGGFPYTRERKNNKTQDRNANRIKGGWEGVLRQACRQEQNHTERRDKLAHRHEEREARLETIGVMLAQVASKASIDSGE